MELSGLHDLLHSFSRRVARFLERRGILERDEDNSYLALAYNMKRLIEIMGVKSLIDAIQA